MMRGPHAGVSLVEVIVAVALLGVQLVAWTSVFRLIAMLTSMSETLFTSGFDDSGGVCLLTFALAPLSRSVSRAGLNVPRLGRSLRQRHGISLVETLLAFALAVLVVGLTLVAASGYRRSAVRIESVHDALATRSAIPIMVRDVLAVAGASLPFGVCGLHVSPGRDRIAVEYRDVTGQGRSLEVFADLDGSGRPALYLRRPPYSKQPWIEGVTSFHVDVPESSHGDRIRAVSARVEHVVLGDAIDFRIEMPHRPCVKP